MNILSTFIFLNNIFFYIKNFDILLIFNFRIACGSQEKAFLSKEEFSTFILNNKDLVSILSASVNRDSYI